MKHYEKPQIFMEEFTTSENIAKCGMNHDPSNSDGFADMKANFYANSDTCNIQYKDPFGDDVNVFLGEACITKWEEGIYNDIGCYQSDIGGKLELFGS